MARRRLLGLAASALGITALPSPAQVSLNLAMDETPAHRVPPEEAPHELTFMQWPSTMEAYLERDFREWVQETILDVANTIAAFEPVILLAPRPEHRNIEGRVAANVTVWDIPTEDLWCRDSGPLFTRLEAGGLAVSHIQFNGWGNRQNHTRDGQVARRVAQRLGLEMIPSGLVGEAGGVEQDGHGLLMAHESSWLTENRNPGMSRAEIEARLLAAYGSDRMIWARGLQGEDITDYHIDSLARFTGPGRALMNLPERADHRDPFHAAAYETYDALTLAQIPIEVIFEPERPRQRHVDFVASYANYYVCNGAVILAEFGDRAYDDAAASALARAYPGREVVQLNVDALGLLGGGIHCATQQMPAV